MDNYGILSLAPALVAVILAFITREALFSILCGVLVGLLITGQDLLFGFTGIIQSALGNADFIWVIGIEVFIGIMVAFFQKSGAIEAVANKLNEKLHITPRIAQIMGAALGVLVFFSDYFSPLFVGNVMRPITDKAKVSREKLAYIVDSTTAAVPTLFPISAWGAYIIGLIATFYTSTGYNGNPQVDFAAGIPYLHHRLHPHGAHHRRHRLGLRPHEEGRGPCAAHRQAVP